MSHLTATAAFYSARQLFAPLQINVKPHNLFACMQINSFHPLAQAFFIRQYSSIGSAKEIPRTATTNKFWNSEMKAMAKLSTTGKRQMPGLSSLVAQLVSLAASKQTMATTQRIGQTATAAYRSGSSLLAGLACPAFAAIGSVGNVGGNVRTNARNHAGRPETLSIHATDWKYAGSIRGGTP